MMLGWRAPVAGWIGAHLAGVALPEYSNDEVRVLHDL